MPLVCGYSFRAFLALALFLKATGIVSVLKPTVKSAENSLYSDDLIKTSLHCFYASLGNHCPVFQFTWLDSDFRPIIPTKAGLFSIERKAACVSSLTVAARPSFSLYNSLYRCKVLLENGLESVSNPILLEARIQLRESTKTVYVLDHSGKKPFEIECPSKPSYSFLKLFGFLFNPVYVKWYKNNEMLPEKSTKYDYRRNQFVLKVSNFTNQDMGQYKCYLIGGGALLSAHNFSIANVVPYDTDIIQFHGTCSQATLLWTPQNNSQLEFIEVQCTTLFDNQRFRYLVPASQTSIALQFSDSAACRIRVKSKSETSNFSAPVEMHCPQSKKTSAALISGTSAGMVSFLTIVIVVVVFFLRERKTKSVRKAGETIPIQDTQPHQSVTFLPENPGKEYSKSSSFAELSRESPTRFSHGTAV